MAYTATVTKSDVKKVSESIYNITLDIVVNNGASDIFEESASAEYNMNEPDLDGFKARLIATFKEKWDKFAVELGIYTSGALNTIVSEIQTSANNYINS